MKKIKTFLIKHKKICRATAFVYSLIMRNKKKIKGKNYINIKRVFLNKTNIEICGEDNEIEICDFSVLKNSHIYIRGSHNRIIIGSQCNLNGLEIWMEDDNNVCNIGEHTWITGNTHMAVIEGTIITIGSRCLFASEIVLRTGDSHSILNMHGERLNLSKNIEIDEHVWIGNKVMVLKHSRIGRDSIVGACALVSGEYKQNVVLAGVPAKVVKENVTWNSERI